MSGTNKKKKTVITIEAWQRTVVRKLRAPVYARCQRFGTENQMYSPEEAAIASVLRHALSTAKSKTAIFILLKPQRALCSSVAILSNQGQKNKEIIMFINIKNSNGYRTIAEITELVEAFERCTLPRGKWTHAAFLTVVLWYLHMQPTAKARILLRNSINRYNFENNIARGQTGSYNETLTVFWLRIVNEFIKNHSRDYSFVDLANLLIERFADCALPLRHYSSERLFSAEAQMTWLRPDKQMKNNKFEGEELCETEVMHSFIF